MCCNRNNRKGETMGLNGRAEARLIRYIIDFFSWIFGARR